MTTPQNIALADARKGIEMFAKVNVPILGIVENMSYFDCNHCGTRHNVFSADGGDLVAKEYNTSVVGRFPLDPRIRELTDDGLPPVAQNPDAKVSQLFTQSARQVAAKLWQLHQEAAPPPTIKMA